MKNNLRSIDFNALSNLPPPCINKSKFYTLKKIIFKNAITKYIAAHYEWIVNSEKMSEITLQSFKMANLSPSQNAGEFGSGYGYDDEIREVAVAIQYKKEIDAEFQSMPDSSSLYRHVDEVISKLISEDSTINKVIDFGVSYAHTDALLAEKFPSIKFVGLDRSILTKAFNEQYFSHLTNLELIASDIFEYFSKHNCNNSIFWTMRTTLLLPKDFLLKLYAEAFKAGVKYICLFEPIGISRETMKPYQFSYNDQPSVGLRDGMFIHNYPGILRSSGYSVHRAELINMRHPHPDVKVLSITASIGE
jgi:hypothetical protein